MLAFLESIFQLWEPNNKQRHNMLFIQLLKGINALGKKKGKDGLGTP